MDRLSVLHRMSGILAEIPPGKVLSYGRLAELAGAPGEARLAAWLCRHLPEPGMPWHRVLSSDGRSRIPDEGTRREQFERLWLEDVPFRASEQVDMSLASWRPEERIGDLPIVGR
jgi:methylated-DNA-protein-cysteine methyltransferase related protein